MKLRFDDEDLKESNYFGFEGKFLSKITKWDTSKSQAGNQVISIEMKGVGPNKGQTGKEFITLTEKHMWKMANLFKAAGYTPEELKKDGGDPNNLIGKVVVLHRYEPTKETYNGKERTNYKVRFYQPSDAEMATVGLDVDETPSESSVPNFDDTSGGESDIPF